MIPLERNRAEIHPDFLGAKRRERLTELFVAAKVGRLEQKKIKKRLFSSSRWKNSKRQLGAEAFGKCAFCEAPISAAYFGDVDHFRPKSIYWWLAYCYDNYLYSCRVCNGKKSDKHQLSGTAIPAPNLSGNLDEDDLFSLADNASPSPERADDVSAFRAACAAEEAPLPNPYQTNPEELFIWTAFPDDQEVHIAPKPGSDRAVSAFDAMMQIVEINREELCIWRWRTYSMAEKLNALILRLPAEYKDAPLELIRGMTGPEAPFSAMVRYYAVEEWQLDL